MIKSIPGVIIGNMFALALLAINFLSPERVCAQFVKGADIGWLSQMEETGFKFYDSTGVQKECLQILKEAGINTVRLRVWVNPSNDKTNGHCNKKEVAAMALRAKNMGMRIMIDFHYSDSWADPAKQTKPVAWASHPFSQLLTDLYDHTYEVLDTLKSIGAKPDWVQIGNEITGGMLWPDGSTSNWGQLAQLLNKGYDAAKAVDSSIKTIIHLDQGNNNSRFLYFFENATSYNVRYDIIGASYYPYWLGSNYTATINDLGNNLKGMVTRYGKEVMVVEVGGDYTLVQDTYNMLVAVIKKVSAVPDHKGLGVFYWEPEGAKSWSGYRLSCWGSDGKPTRALYAFLYDPTLGINTIKNDPRVKVYPNPNFDGLLNVELPGITGVTTLHIFDVNGKMVESQILENKPVASVDVSTLHGFYLITIHNHDLNFSQKIVIN
jgi:arabinogalactan endo-1,4-beta-galactosidase